MWSSEFHISLAFCWLPRTCGIKQAKGNQFWCCRLLDHPRGLGERFPLYIKCCNWLCVWGALFSLTLKYLLCCGLRQRQGTWLPSSGSNSVWEILDSLKNRICFHLQDPFLFPSSKGTVYFSILIHMKLHIERHQCRQRKRGEFDSIKVLNLDLRQDFSVIWCMMYVTEQGVQGFHLVKISILTEAGVGYSHYKEKEPRFPLDSSRSVHTARCREAASALPSGFPSLIRKHTQSSFSKIKSQLIGLWNVPLELALVGKHLSLYWTPTQDEGRRWEEYAMQE